jgi:hypothetical protein
MKPCWFVELFLNYERREKKRNFKREGTTRKEKCEAKGSKGTNGSIDPQSKQ